MFKKYRIMEIDGKFIPQVRKNLFNSWGGIDSVGIFLWYNKNYQEQYCSCDTLALAKNTIEKYKELIKKPVITYHYL